MVLKTLEVCPMCINGTVNSGTSKLIIIGLNSLVVQPIGVIHHMQPLSPPPEYTLTKDGGALGYIQFYQLSGRPNVEVFISASLNPRVCQFLIDFYVTQRLISSEMPEIVKKNSFYKIGERVFVGETCIGYLQILTFKNFEGYKTLESYLKSLGGI